MGALRRVRGKDAALWTVVAVFVVFAAFVAPNLEGPDDVRTGLGECSPPAAKASTKSTTRASLPRGPQHDPEEG